MDLLVAALPFLVLLACPLMMVFCVFGMRRMGGATPRANEAAGATSPEERIADLHLQVRAIQAELAALEAVDRNPDGENDRVVAAEAAPLVTG